LKLAAVAVTPSGRSLARYLQSQLDGLDIYLPPKFRPEQENSAAADGVKADISRTGEPAGLTENFYRGSLGEKMGELMAEYEGIICIMALGIVVRTVSPWLEDKRSDPAVVVVDEKGRYAISALSGHVGGANRLSRQLASILGAEAVITTATDVRGRLAFDLLAEELGWQLRPFESLKKANSALLTDDIEIEIWCERSEYRYAIENLDRAKKPELSLLEEDVILRDSGPAAENINSEEQGELRKGDLEEDLDSGFTVLVSNGYLSDGYLQEKREKGRLIQLIPGNLIAGIGARRGIEKEIVLGALEKAQQELELRPGAFKALATADIKADEEGIKGAAEDLGLPLQVIDRERIAQELERSEEIYSTSNFVKEKIGVGGVCEPAAMAAAEEGDLILSKRAFQGVTIAVVEDLSM